MYIPLENINLEKTGDGTVYRLLSNRMLELDKVGPLSNSVEILLIAFDIANQEQANLNLEIKHIQPVSGINKLIKTIVFVGENPIEHESKTELRFTKKIKNLVSHIDRSKVNDIRNYFSYDLNPIRDLFVQEEHMYTIILGIHRKLSSWDFPVPDLSIGSYDSLFWTFSSNEFSKIDFIYRSIWYKLLRLLHSQNLAIEPQWETIMQQPQEKILGLSKDAIRAEILKTSHQLVLINKVQEKGVENVLKKLSGTEKEFLENFIASGKTADEFYNNLKNKHRALVSQLSSTE